jgi:predicted signal transduction protein with EAL and GGDEF domain
VLCEVARRLEDTVRVSDTAARFGGDEFAVLLESLDSPQDAAETAERILRSFVAPLNVEGKELSLRGSIGIAVVEPGDATQAEELLRNADAAMYIAKREGKGNYRMFEPAMQEGVLARLELRGDLQRALVEEQFVLHYQPLVRLDTGEVSSVEALLRWQHPERGLVAPTDFVPFAEETGLIVDIGRWVLQEGCRHAKRLELLHDQPLTMAVNLSVKQLQHPDVVRHVAEALADADLDPSRLTLEITESVMMDDADLAAERLRELKALGLRLALDDFGTGYSSLSYLGRFPLDVLKMDRSFLREDAPPETAGLANAVIAIGNTMQLDIVAEGVEQHTQFDVLRQLGCDFGQGFLFARPLTGAELDLYLQARTAAPAG